MYINFCYAMQGVYFEALQRSRAQRAVLEGKVSESSGAAVGTVKPVKKQRGGHNS
jgi:hypothetical protein